MTIALKELHPNCIQVGTTTFGKGVVQSSFMLSDGSVIKITTSYWTSPNGNSFNGTGIVPDEETFLDEDLTNRMYTLKEDETLELDSVSALVRSVQLCLKYLDYNVERCDGYFDKSLEKALATFQKDLDLEVNGILDSKTVDSIYNKVIYTFNSIPTKDDQLKKALEVIGE